MQDPSNRADSDDTLPFLEPLAPGEDMPCSAPPKLEDRRQKSEERMAEIFAQANARKDRAAYKEEGMDWQTLLLLLVFLGLLVLIMEVAILPDWLVIPAMLLPPSLGIGTRVCKHGMPFQQAVADCKVHIVLSIGFLFIGILFIW